MLDLIRRHPLGFTLAVLMHVAIVLLMIFGLDWLNPPQIQKPTGQVVQARLVDTEQFARQKKIKREAEKHQIEKKRRQEEKKKEEKKKKEQQRLEAERKKQLEIKRQKEQKKKQAAEKKKKEEQRKKAEAEKKRKLALKKKEEEKKKQQELERKKKLEQEKKRKEEARKKEEAKKKAEARKKAEAEKKAELERKKKAEAERKRKAAEAKRIADQKAREAELQAQWAAERDGRERDSVTAAIKRKVQNSWLRPPGAADRDLQATVRVRLNDSGSVLLVRVIKSSGNSAFDRSVVAAVNKADPLPMPKSPTLISEFREFTFIFRPSK